MRAMKKCYATLLAVAVAILMVFSSFNGITAKADTASKAVLEAKNGVVEVNVNYVDSANKAHLVQSGSGFLIGSGGSSGAQYVVTNYHVVNISDSDLPVVKSYFGVTSDLNTRVEVVVKGDVTVTATILKQSQNADYAILKLDEVVYDREVLTLAKNAKMSQTQNVYALGFPAILTYVEDHTYYTTNDVTVTQGTVTKNSVVGNLNYIQHSAALTNGNSGGPLVDDNGYVVGLNTSGVDSTYFYSLNIDEVISTLDSFGIAYKSTSGSSTTTPSASETQASSEAVTEATTAATTQAATEAAATPAKNSSGLDTTTLIIIIAVAAVVVIAIIIIIAVVASGKKKKKAEEERRRRAAANQAAAQPRAAQQPMGGFNTPPVAPQVPPVPSAPTMGGFDSGAGETSVLDNGAGETSVLGMGQNSATLVRSKTGENIAIRKATFAIGKERNRVDYCITNNNSISRQHANIVCKGGSYFLVDLNSTNGTYVNGQQVAPNQEVRLNPNDKIKFADEEFTFR